jgi:large subunit ribosomal protein L4
MKVPVLNLAGENTGEVELDDRVFGLAINEPLLHQAIVWYQNNRRVGTHDTRTRAEVAGGGRKPYRQKGTGHARQGSRRAPHWRGGGVVFGPHPRDYHQDLPRKMRRLAIRNALSAKAQANQLIVVEDFDLEAPRTRTMVNALRAWGVERSAVVVLGQPTPNVLLSLRNIPHVDTLPPTSLGALAILSHQKLILSRSAVQAVQAWLGDGERAEEATHA